MSGGWMRANGLGKRRRLSSTGSKCTGPRTGTGKCAFVSAPFVAPAPSFHLSPHPLGCTLGAPLVMSILLLLWVHLVPHHLSTWVRMAPQHLSKMGSLPPVSIASDMAMEGSADAVPWGERSAAHRVGVGA